MSIVNDGPRLRVRKRKTREVFAPPAPAAEFPFLG
jgi:hypothetical protein